jgi:NAD(P)-dependent dehydrogenase (short-subunit alcohol dehydrogenase family)
MTDKSIHETGRERRKFLGHAAGTVALIAGMTARADTRCESLGRTAVAPGGRFAGKVILVTGATSGIGAATARAFAREDGKVFFCGRRAELGRQVQADMERSGGFGRFIQADVRDEEQVRRFVTSCLDASGGKLDVAYNNAAVLPARLAATAEWSPDELMNVWRTNFLGCWYCMRHQLPVMARQGGGVVINCATVGAHRSYPGIVPYTSSKAALVSMSRSAAAEYGKQNVRVISISPGQVDTQMLVDGARLGEPANEEPTITPSNALNRIMAPEEIARAILWLASPEASCITGCDVDVSAGQLIT